jgi:riboflavin biosynthesis pyrimidine reductase
VIVRRLHPSPQIEFDLATEGGVATLAGNYTPPLKRWLRINLIASVNGAAAGDDGTSNSLTNRVDRRILGTIRRLADVVLVGAGSVRAEGYVLPRTAPLAIITGKGDLSGHRIPADVPAGRLMVLCPSRAVAMVTSTLGSATATIIALDDSPEPGLLDVAEAIAALRERGFESIVCEGGPLLAAQLINHDLVDEVCLTTSPQLSPAPLPVLSGLSSTRSLQLTQLFSDESSYLFARWALTR